MPIPFRNKIKKVRKNIRIDIKLPDDNSNYIAWWYCGFYKNKNPEQQPHVLVAFRKLFESNLSDDVYYSRVPLTTLGQIKIGTVWRDNLCRYESDFKNKEFLIDFSPNKWRFNSFSDAIKNNPPPPYPMAIHPLGYLQDRNWVIEFDLSSGGKLVVPCIDFFYRCYGRSAELKRILATYPWHGEDEAHISRLYAPTDEPEEPNIWKVKLRKRLVNGDIIFLAHAKYDSYTEKAAKLIYNQLESRYNPESKSPIFLKARPWFTGLAQLEANGISFDNGRSFLCLHVSGCSNPGGVPIQRDRDNTNKVDGQVEFSDDAAWNGRPERILTPSSTIIDLTDVSPDQGADSIEIQDPAFKELGIPRTVLDIRRAHRHKSSGSFGHDPSLSSAFTCDAPYGGGKGVGSASIYAPSVMESHGALRDMWNAMLFLKEQHANSIESVEFYTFKNGFQKDSEPSLIALKPFQDYIKATITPEIRNWLYFDIEKRIPRGVLVARMIINGKSVFIFEIQRRQRKKNDGGIFVDSEEAFRGLVFVLNDQKQVEEWLKRLLSRVRYVKGIVQKLESLCPGKAISYCHRPAQNERVPCEAALKNALSKIGIL